MKRRLAYALFFSCMAIAAPRVGFHDNSARLVFDLPWTSPFTLQSQDNQLTIALERTLDRVSGVLNVFGPLNYATVDRTIVLKAKGIGNRAQVTSLPAVPPAEGMRLIIDIAAVPPSLLQPEFQSCLQPDPQIPSLDVPKPPASLSGDLGLYVAVVDPQTLRPTRVVAQNPNMQFPLASAYKQAVLHALLQDVDQNTIGLEETLTTTEFNRSLEFYPTGTNTLRVLAERMIQKSDNTATDLLHRRIGLEKPQALADRLGLCKTRLLLPTKAWWVAQAGMAKDFPDSELLEASRRYSSAPRPQQLEIARRLDAEALKIKPDVLYPKLDRYFMGPQYNPEIDRNTQNASTPFEFAQLIAFEFMGNGLTPSSQNLFRDIMGKGCCAKRLKPYNYAGAKGGSGWRILTMTGYLEMPQGERIVYVFLNNKNKRDEGVESDIPAAMAWVKAAIERLKQ
ncbi:MAG: serine hydrolase [Deinococcaceae bacterium]